MKNIKKLIKKPQKEEFQPPIKEFPLFPANFPENKQLTFYLPTSQHILYLLTLFDRFATVSLSIDQIDERIGIGMNNVLVCCTQLEKIGYIKKVPGSTPEKYIKSEESEMSEEKSEIIKRIKEEIIERYQENPYNIKTKTEEVELFGHPLPLENGTKEDVISTGISNLDRILHPIGEEGKQKGGIVADKCILIKGAPGTGKTTFGMQFLCANKNLNSIYITFEEDLQQLKDDFKRFEWNLNQISIMPLRFSKKDYDKKKIFDELANILDEKSPDILVMDSINHLTGYVSAEESKELLSDFISILKIRHITSLLIGEETIGYSFEEYIVDGLIRLVLENGERFLEIAKIRGQDFVEGRHSYKICDADAVRRENEGYGEKGPYTCGINVFPNITYYTELVKRKGGKDEPESKR